MRRMYVQGESLVCHKKGQWAELPVLRNTSPPACLVLGRLWQPDLARSSAFGAQTGSTLERNFWLRSCACSCTPRDGMICACWAGSEPTCLAHDKLAFCQTGAMGGRRWLTVMVLAAMSALCSLQAQEEGPSAARQQALHQGHSKLKVMLRSMPSISHYQQMLGFAHVLEQRGHELVWLWCAPAPSRPVPHLPAFHCCCMAKAFMTRSPSTRQSACWTHTKLWSKRPFPSSKFWCVCNHGAQEATLFPQLTLPADGWPGGGQQWAAQKHHPKHWSADCGQNECHQQSPPACVA